MKGKFDAKILYPLAKRVQNWIVTWSTVRNYMEIIQVVYFQIVYTTKFLKIFEWKFYLTVFLCRKNLSNFLINWQTKETFWRWVICTRYIFFKLPAFYCKNISWTKIRCIYLAIYFENEGTLSALSSHGVQFGVTRKISLKNVCNTRLVLLTKFS